MWGGDPFFNTMHNQMRAHMHAMDNMMNDVMGGGSMFGDPFANPALENGSTHRHDPRSQMLRHNDPFADPFSAMMPFGGGLLGGLMENMNRMTNMDPGQLVDNVPGGGHVYSQSTVINFNGDGQPRVVHRTNEARKIGNAKETRQTTRNMETGEESIAIGHHVGDRAHIIEKRRDSREGNIKKKEKFINLAEERARDFEDQFAAAAQPRTLPTTRALPSHSGPIIEELPADSPSHSRRALHSRRRYQQDEPNGPIIEEPDDDQPRGASDSKRGRSRLWHA